MRGWIKGWTFLQQNQLNRGLLHKIVHFETYLPVGTFQWEKVHFPFCETCLTPQNVPTGRYVSRRTILCYRPLNALSVCISDRCKVIPLERSIFVGQIRGLDNLDALYFIKKTLATWGPCKRDTLYLDWAWQPFNVVNPIFLFNLAINSTWKMSTKEE